ncbi:MAG: DUF6328 family protein [Pseudonocardia sp.]|nr:DUF6328 family protein [Pseudonocardia sp.]
MGNSQPDDAGWDRAERNETPTERLDRNWSDLLQELRVVQTGVQLLTGLLLTVPFQQRFGELDDFQKLLYLITVSLSVTATALLVAPVATHRTLFRLHARAFLVGLGQRLAIGGLGMLALAVTGVVLLIFDTVAGLTAGIVAAVVTVAVFGVFWAVLPLRARRRALRARETGRGIEAAG